MIKIFVSIDADVHSSDVLAFFWSNKNGYAKNYDYLTRLINN